MYHKTLQATGLFKGAATYDKQENVGEGSRQTYSAVLELCIQQTHRRLCSSRLQQIR